MKYMLWTALILFSTNGIDEIYLGIKIIFFELRVWREIKVIDVHFDRQIKAVGIHTYNSHGGYEIIDIKSKYIDIKIWVVRISKLLRDKIKNRWGNLL